MNREPVYKVYVDGQLAVEALGRWRAIRAAADRVAPEVDVMVLRANDDGTVTIIA